MAKNKIPVKNKTELKLMEEGGKRLARIKKELVSGVKIGSNAGEIEKLAINLIYNEGGKPSFKMVPNYSWATCVNVNEGIVHGIPKREVIFRKGDVVSVDVGLFFKGFHTDTSFSVGLDVDNETKEFLKIGKSTLIKAIKNAKKGKRIYDISNAMQKGIEEKRL